MILTRTNGTHVHSICKPERRAEGTNEVVDVLIFSQSSVIHKRGHFTLTESLQQECLGDNGFTVKVKEYKYTQ